jgi:hypothetical protein
MLVGPRWPRDIALDVHATATQSATPRPLDRRTTDPIFALIEAHRTAEGERGKILRQEDDWDTEVCKEASEAAWAAHAAVLATPPTTLAGVAAVLTYAGGPYVDGQIETDTATVFSVALEAEGFPLGERWAQLLIHDCCHSRAPFSALMSKQRAPARRLCVSRTLLLPALRAAS